MFRSLNCDYLAFSVSSKFLFQCVQMANPRPCHARMTGSVVPLVATLTSALAQQDSVRRVKGQDNGDFVVAYSLIRVSEWAACRVGSWSYVDTIHQ